MVTKKKGRKGQTIYEVYVYDPSSPAKNKMRYVGTRPKEGSKTKRSVQDPAVYAYAREYEAEPEMLAAAPARGARTLSAMRPLWVNARTHEHAEKRWRGSTEKHNIERTNALLERFGDRHPDTIDPMEALDWAMTMPACIPAARALVNWAKAKGMCRTNPFEKLGIGKGPGRKDDPPLTEDDLARLDAAATVLGSYAAPWRGWLYFQAFVGCRPAEGLAVKRAAHIDLTAGEVRIARQKYRTGALELPKNGRERTVILPAPARERLALIPTRIDSPWLFHNKRGDELLYSSMLGYWHTVVAASGLALDERWPQGIDPYHLRHFCGSHLADMGVSARDIAIQLGHTDGGALAQKLYIHDYEDRALKRLHAAFAPADNTITVRPRWSAAASD